MAKNKQPEISGEQKVQTKYDRKVEERKKQEVKDKRDARIMRIGAIAVCAAIVIAIVVSVGASVISKNAAVKDTYVTIGDHAVTKLEYDYYYNTAVNNYLTTYESIISYIGLDPNEDFDKQQYTDTWTWKDLFDQMTVQQIQQTKAVVDDAAANSFTYDETEDYNNMLSSIKSGSETAGVSVADQYKTAYGSYATESNMAPIIKEGLLATAYYQEMMTKNTPAEQEVKDYYEEHTQEYDKVDYRSFVFTADIAEGATESDIDKAMLDIKAKADTMMETRQAGADFKELCVENAAEDQKANYEAAETDASLNEGKYFAGISSYLSGWLYEEGRAEGDITVIEDPTNHQYYVVEFVSRYYDEADNETIANTIASEKTAGHIEKLIENYTVTDNKGDLKYLTVDMNAGTEEATDTGNTETEATEAEGDTAE